ncbi:MAG: hypothetical protein MPJ50_09340 [Pirellulales bacterium]|nr:hypothetical protein [Pirellulales bacterium]
MPSPSTHRRFRAQPIGFGEGLAGEPGSVTADKSTFITTHPNAGLLIEIVTQTVDPDSWEVKGGWGSIAEYDGKLVVRQTDAAHAQIQYLLDNLGSQERPSFYESTQPALGR